MSYQFSNVSFHSFRGYNHTFVYCCTILGAFFVVLGLNWNQMWQKTSGKVSCILVCMFLHNWLFSLFSLILRQPPMSSTNKRWWVIWNVKTLPNMTQISRKVTIGIGRLVRQCCSNQTQTSKNLYRNKSWVANLTFKTCSLEVWSFGQFMAPWQICGNLWAVLNGRELTGASRRPIPRQAYTGLSCLIFLLLVFALT